MGPDVLLQIIGMMEPDELGRLVAQMNAKNIPKDDLFDARRPGYRGIPIQMPKMRKGVFGASKDGWRS
jgi:hypothetical protein